MAVRNAASIRCLLVALLAVVATPVLSQTPPFVVSCGALECEFTRHGLDALRWRDRPVIGDSFSDARPCLQPVLLKQGWQRLARPTDEGAREAVVERTEDAVTVKLSGVMSEDGDGPGRWDWQQTWAFRANGLLTVDHRLEQLVASRERWWLHRWQLIGNRTELFVEYPNKDKHTPGKPIPIHSRDGRDVTPLFGGEGNIVAQPERVELPFAGHKVILRPDAQARSVELWNGWWQQCINFELPVAETVETSLEVDLSDLPQTAAPRFALAEVPPEEQPWETAQLAPLPPVTRRLRLAQQAPGVIAWGEVRPHKEEDLERFFAEMAKHFDIMELGVAWTDWKWDLGWDRDEAARKHAEAIAAEVRKEVRLAHRHGIKIALSLNFGGSGPGVGKLETRRQPQFQGETFDPETGAFAKNRDAFDWANQAAVASARRAFTDCARLVGPVDYLFFNEPLWRMSTWYAVPLFSEAALADFREFVGDPQARFPAKPYAADTPRTDNQATAADWKRWSDWAQDRFARSIRVQAEAFAAANAGNPDYGGAIYFQHVGWTGPQYAVDLDRLAALPQVTWLVAEYVTDARSPLWRKFRYYAARHGKPLSSFVNIGQYDPDSPGRVKYEGTDAGFEAAVEMGIAENAPMVTLYPADSLDRASPAFHAARTAIWDRLTAPAGP